MLLMLSEALPVFVKVIGLTAELVCTFSDPKARLVADNCNLGAVACWVPVPVRVMAGAELFALQVKVTLADCDPVLVGAN